MSIGARIKELRIRKRESLQQLADTVGASKPHIWELEVEKSTNPSVDLLKKDRRALQRACLLPAGGTALGRHPDFRPRIPWSERGRQEALLGYGRTLDAQD